MTPAGPIVRALSVAPLLLLAALGFIGIVSWVLIVVLGIGSAEPIWTAARGLSPLQLVWQLFLVVLIGLAPLAVVLAASWGVTHGYRVDSGRMFWSVIQAVWGLLSLGLVYVGRVREEWLESFGLSSADWWFLFIVVAFAMILAGVRLRRAPRSTHGEG